MKLKAVIFDFYGTLVEDFASASIGQLQTEFLKALEVPAEPFMKLWKETTEKRVGGAFQTVEASIEHVCDLLAVKLTPERLTRATEIRLQIIRQTLKPKADAVKTLSSLRQEGYKIGLLSNCSIEIAILWEETEFAPLIDSAIFSSRECLKKPDLHMYRVACDRLHVTPDKCLYIADGENYELAAASKVGLHPVLIRNPLSQKRPDLFREAAEWQGRVISELSEVVDLVDDQVRQATDSNIRHAVADDVPAILSCVAAAYERYVARIGKPPAPMLEDYSQVVNRHDVFVLTVDEKVVGVLVLIKEQRSFLLDNVAVHPDYQGRGFGRRLIAFAEEQAKSAGLKLLTLYTNEEMTENIELYKRLGFVEIERRIEQGYRRVYMQKTL